MLTRRLSNAILLSLPLALGLSALARDAAPPPPPPLEVELGWRFVNVTGNEDAFRTQLGERPGFLVRSLRYDLPDTAAGSVADQLRIDAIDLGAGPAGSFRLRAGKTGLWRANLSYHRWERFSVNEGFANPGGTFLGGLHIRDRQNDVLDLQVEALPGRAITPFVGFSWNRLDGPAATTQRVGEDEFRLDSTLHDVETEFTVGASFDAGPVSGRVSQGWRFLRGEESFVLAAGAGDGATPNPVFGKNQTLTTYQRSQKTDVDTPVTNVEVNFRPVERLTVLATYVRSSASADATDAETLSGSLTSFAIRRFFSGLNESVAASADSKLWRGAARVEVAVVSGVDVGLGFSRRNRSLTGTALISTLFSGGTDLNGLNPGDVQTLLESGTSLDRNEEELSVYAAARNLGPFSLRGSYALVDEEVTLHQDATQIVIPGSQDGEEKRRLDRYEGALGFRHGGFTFGVQYRGERANDSVVRTDVSRRDRWRLTAGIDAPWVPWLHLSGAVTDIDEKNGDPAIDYRGSSREWSATLEASPLKVLKLRVSGGRLVGDRSRLVREPQYFLIVPSSSSDRASLAEAGLTLELPFARLDVSGGLVDGTGSLGYEVRRGRALLDVPIGKKLAGIVECAVDKYKDIDTGLHGDYTASRVGLYLRIMP